MAKGGKVTAQALLAKGEELVDQCQPELAIKFFQKAAAMEPNRSEIFDAIGELATEIGDPDTAAQAFGRSIELAPKSNPGKWLYFAQLVQGEESEKYTLQGIAYMKELMPAMPGIENTDESKLLRKQICDAYCSLGELYMSDLCDLDDAEAKCEFYLQEAMKYDMGLPEPTQALANLRLTQQRKDDACACLDETYKRLGQCDENTMPSLEFRTFTGKMLIEVEKFEQACDVLEGVMQEDDENPELWFLVGTCYKALEDYDSALEFLERCESMLSKLKKEMGNEFHLDVQLDEVRALIASINEIEPIEQADEDQDMD
ncbi:hypothetical protein THRCLA_00321 [Thraustotheca clavata]|uniref:Assembly chaperone of rpl4 n=1 Tax=Thraustotheca clavata TaxID=74557 RepID=A0A1W0ABN5_9STRA|nr:hypothetical protein THRCLA_00321 [Thraustotheca clavata]